MTRNENLQLASPRRFHELDSLRGLAAITVVLHHFSRICPSQVIRVLDHTPLRLLIAGHQAVILFFLPSGFVLTLALAFAVLCDLHFSNQSHYDNYWINWTWSVPVTTSLVLQHILFLGKYDWSQFNTAFWSLVYEMRISLVFPFLAIAVLRFRTIWLLLAAVVLSFAFFPLAILFSSVLHLSNRDAAINTALTLHYAAFFVIGSVLAKQLHAVNRWYARLSTVQAAAIAIVSMVLYGFANASSIIERLSIPSDLYDWLAAAGAAMFIVFVTAESKTWKPDESSQTLAAKSRQLVAVWDTLGWILYREGKLDEAEGFLKAAWINAQSDTVAEHVGRLQASGGKTNEALTTYWLGIAASRPGAERKKLQALAEALQKKGAKSPLTDANKKLQEDRKIPLGPANGLNGVAEYKLLLSGDKVVQAKKSGDKDLPGGEERVKEAKLVGFWPAGSDANLVRSAMLNCHSGICEVVLMP